MTKQNNGRSFEIVRGDSLSHEFYPYLDDILRHASLKDIDDAWFTVKDDKSCDDSDAIIQISLTNGLEILNAAPASTPANGKIQIVDDRMRVSLDEVETAVVPLGMFWWDVQILAKGTITETPYLTTLHIVGDATRDTG